ncbi:MAG: hypothetical protein NVSMB66_2220 [Candidatus Doudnabacteria bacterium]
MERITIGTREQRTQLAGLIFEGLHRPQVAESPGAFIIYVKGGESCCALGMAALAKFGCEAILRLELNCENSDWEEIRPRLAHIMGFSRELFDEVDRLHHRMRTPARMIIVMLLPEFMKTEELISPYRDDAHRRELIEV